MQQLLAGMQAVQNLRAQNQAAAQTLAAQIQRLNSQAVLRDAEAQQRLQQAAQQQMAAVQQRGEQQRQLHQEQQQLEQLHQLQRLREQQQQRQDVPSPAPASVPQVALPTSVPPPGPSAQSSASSTHAQGARPPGKVEKEAEEEEIPRCHLHKKQNKACKFCKAYYAQQETKAKKHEEQKSVALEQLRAGLSRSGKGLGDNDKTPLPNLPLFPSVLADRIQKNDFYSSTICSASVSELRGIITSNESCDTETRTDKALDLDPSAFISVVYRFMVLPLTEGQLQMLIRSRSSWTRAAAFLYVRMGMHVDRYWELMSEALMDQEEFVPFPSRGGDTMQVGQYVELLLTKDKYCDITLPRVPVVQRKMLNRRMVMYAQFRKRYSAHLAVLDRFQEEDVSVEICNADGEWLRGRTVEAINQNRTTKTLLVKLESGEEQTVSLGMVICPSSSSSSSSDLTRSRGRSAEELLRNFEAQQKDSALASGKDYCKTSGQHTVRVGGVPFVAGVKRKELETERTADLDEDRRESRRTGPSWEHQAKMAALESKYCARVSSATGGRSETEGPERMRLG